MTSKFIQCALLCTLLLCCRSARSAQYYVSPTGNDSNPGTIDAPFLTIGKAVSLSSTAFAPGDTVCVRGGQHICTLTINIRNIGTPAARYYLIAYPGERPLLDFSSMTVASSNRGINLRGSYWYVRGIDIKGAGDNGMNVSGSNNIIEFCSFFENFDTGLQLSGGASNNQIINCDSYFNADTSQGNADGFAPKLDVGTNNAFYGCRSWQNSDDGWDGYLRPANDVTTTLENCWCFMNGYLKDGTTSTGNGNGYKLGGSDAKDLKHNFILKKCLAVDNRVKGFDQNNNRGSMTLYNCTGYRNGTNYQIADTLAPGKTLTVINCVALGPYGQLSAAATQQTNSWMPPFGPVTAADFISVDTTGLRGPRKPDGSLPDITCLFPASGSQLIDAGTPVGLPFNGTAPDLGVFETAGVVWVENTPEEVGTDFRMLQNYPNPFNSSTTIGFVIPDRGDVRVRIYDVYGRLVGTLLQQELPAGYHATIWDGRGDGGLPVASGMYFALVEHNNLTRVIKLVMAK